jgi:hypothetical protein
MLDNESATGSKPDAPIAAWTGQRRLWPLEEVRQQLGGISRATLYGLLKDQIKLTKIGARSFVADDELNRYIASLKEAA